MQFPFHVRLPPSMLPLLAVIVICCGCAADADKGGDGSNPSNDITTIGGALDQSFRFHQAFHRSSKQRHPGVITSDESGNRYVSAFRIVDVQDQAKRLPRDLPGQILVLPKHSSSAGSELMLYADGFHEIEQLIWHDGRLHVIHGYDYSTVIGTPGQPAKAKREDRSRTPAANDLRCSRTIDEVNVLQGILSDRKEPNDRRINALWRLRDMTNECIIRPSASGWVPAADMTPAEFDPVKAFVTAMHNGPDALRAQAARALRMHSVDTRPAIKGLIHRAKNDTNATVRMEAALTLGHLKAKDAAVELMGSLDDPDDTARIAKVLAIRMIDEWELAPAFVNAASERTREGMLLALQDVQHSQAIAALKFAAISSPYPTIRMQAITLLELAAFPRFFMDDSFMIVMHELAMSSGHPDFQSPELPRWRLVRSKSEHLDSIIEKVRQATKDEDAGVRTAAAQSLSRISSQQ